MFLTYAQKQLQAYETGSQYIDFFLEGNSQHFCPSRFSYFVQNANLDTQGCPD